MSESHIRDGKGQLFDDQYRLIKPLSTSGGSADVWLALDLSTIDSNQDESEATKVAIKIYRPKNIIDIEGEAQFRSEFKKVFNCHHENIIKPTYFSIYNETPYLVMPFCPNGSAEKLLGKLTDSNELWKFIYEVASGLAYMHEHTPQIIHQDIKPANVLIDDNGSYAITDFGISAAMEADATSLFDDDKGGTFAYMAPERFEDNATPLPESDIWAFGASLYELITGDTPFGNDGGRIQHRDKKIPQIKQGIPDSIKQLIYSCLSYDLSQRPTARNIVDTVLQKRYSTNKKVYIISAVLLSVIGAVLLAFFLRPDNKQDTYTQFEKMCEKADSVLNEELTKITDDDIYPASGSIQGLDNAVMLYINACNLAPEELEKTDSIQQRINMIDAVKIAISQYDSVATLAMRAKRAEMEEQYIENSLKQEIFKEKIDQLISQIPNK